MVLFLLVEWWFISVFKSLLIALQIKWKPSEAFLGICCAFSCAGGNIWELQTRRCTSDTGTLGPWFPGGFPWHACERLPPPRNSCHKTGILFAHFPWELEHSQMRAADLKQKYSCLAIFLLSKVVLMKKLKYASKMSSWSSKYWF